MNAKKRLLCSLVACLMLAAIIIFRNHHTDGTKNLMSKKASQFTLEPSRPTTSKHYHDPLLEKESQTTPYPSPRPVTTLSPDELPGRHTCSNLDRYMRSSELYECPIVYEYVTTCLRGTGVGRTPLPNFFNERNNSRDTDDEAYMQANVAFVHVPKAGGTSVESILQKIPGLHRAGKVRKMRVAHCRDQYVHATRFRGYEEQTFFFSKRSFGLHEFAYPGRPFAYVAWFREPVDRLVSTYFYAKRKRCFGVHRICFHYLARSDNLTDYLQKTTDVRLQDMDNYHVRLLQFGDYPDVDTTFEDCCGGVELEDAETIPSIEEKHYLVARNNLLTKIAFVGLTEDFKTSQDMLCHVFGIPLQEREIHVNANAHDYNITAFELAEIRRRNVWDLKLYDDAKALYDHQKKMYLQGKENKF